MSATYFHERAPLEHNLLRVEFNHHINTAIGTSMKSKIKRGQTKAKKPMWFNVLQSAGVNFQLVGCSADAAFVAVDDDQRYFAAGAMYIPCHQLIWMRGKTFFSNEMKWTPMNGFQYSVSIGFKFSLFICSIDLFGMFRIFECIVVCGLRLRAFFFQFSCYSAVWLLPSLGQLNAEVLKFKTRVIFVRQNFAGFSCWKSK